MTILRRSLRYIICYEMVQIMTNDLIWVLLSLFCYQSMFTKEQGQRTGQFMMKTTSIRPAVQDYTSNDLWPFINWQFNCVGRINAATTTLQPLQNVIPIRHLNYSQITLNAISKPLNRWNGQFEWDQILSPGYIFGCFINEKIGQCDRAAFIPLLNELVNFRMRLSRANKALRVIFWTNKPTIKVIMILNEPIKNVTWPTVFIGYQMVLEDMWWTVRTPFSGVKLRRSLQTCDLTWLMMAQVS